MNPSFIASIYAALSGIDRRLQISTSYLVIMIYSLSVKYGEKQRFQYGKQS